jgi:hypothetical protein
MEHLFMVGMHELDSYGYRKVIAEMHNPATENTPLGIVLLRSNPPNGQEEVYRASLIYSDEDYVMLTDLHMLGIAPDPD